MASCFILNLLLVFYFGINACVLSDGEYEPVLREIPNQFKTESSCPVGLLSAKTILEIDPLERPVACRIYLEYKNVGNKQISGATFRIGYLDLEDKVRGAFHAPDAHLVEANSTTKQKWRGEKIDPRVCKVILRCLGARFSDGTIWESEKLKELNNPESTNSEQELQVDKQKTDNVQPQVESKSSRNDNSEPASQNY